jgi:hypothetical protein
MHCSARRSAPSKVGQEVGGLRRIRVWGGEVRPKAGNEGFEQGTGFGAALLLAPQARKREGSAQFVRAGVLLASQVQAGGQRLFGPPLVANSPQTLALNAEQVGRAPVLRLALDLLQSSAYQWQACLGLGLVDPVFGLHSQKVGLELLAFGGA